jgi:hypothetical protein
MYKEYMELSQVMKLKYAIAASHDLESQPLEGKFWSGGKSESGLVLSEKRTLQGIYTLQVWPEGEEVSRRAMRAAVFPEI